MVSWDQRRLASNQLGKVKVMSVWLNQVNQGNQKRVFGVGPEYSTPPNITCRTMLTACQLSRTAVSFMFHVHKLTNGLTIAGTYRTLFSRVTLQLPGLNAYEGYCSNQLAAKALLDRKKQDPGVQDFLQRCLESPFSRKLDLWSFLDNPRSRLVKYPLLLKEILRHTPEDHPDVQLLQEAVSTPTNDSCVFQICTLACLRKLCNATPNYAQ